MELRHCRATVISRIDFRIFDDRSDKSGRPPWSVLPHSRGRRWRTAHSDCLSNLPSPRTLGILILNFICHCEPGGRSNLLANYEIASSLRTLLATTVLVCQEQKNQAVCERQGGLVRTMAFKMTSNFRMQAVRATFFSLPC